MRPELGFVISLAVTLALLGGVVWSGYHARRPVHLTLVVSAILSLGGTIFFAEQLGTYYDLEGAGWIYPVHLAIAKTCTAAYVLPVVTGILVIRKSVSLRLHRIAAFSVLGLTVLTALTGTWMVLASERIASAERGDALPTEVRAAERAASTPR